MITFDGLEPWGPEEPVLGLQVPDGEFYDLSELGVLSATIDFHLRSLEIAAKASGGATLIRLTVGDIEAIYVADPGYSGHGSVALSLERPLEVSYASISHSDDVGDGRGWLSFGVDAIDIAFRARSVAVCTAPYELVDRAGVSAAVSSQPVSCAVSVLSLNWDVGVPRVVLVAADSAISIDSAHMLRLPVTREPVSLVHDGQSRAVRMRSDAIDGVSGISLECWEHSWPASG
ncbi:hypothetical protein [Cellulomonas soli]